MISVFFHAIQNVYFTVSLQVNILLGYKLLLDYNYVCLQVH